ncbi:MAG: ATP-binding protein, partial [Chloroflexota bacterium]
TIYYGFALFLGPRDGSIDHFSPFTVSFIILFIFGVGNLSASRGYYHIVAPLMVWGSFVVAVLGIQFLEFGFYSPLFYMVFTSIIFAGFFLGSRHLWLLTSFACVSMAWFYVQENLGWKVTGFPTPRVDFLIMNVLLMLVTAYSTHRIVLELVRQSVELHHYQDHLEELVDDCTTKLETALGEAEAANRAKGVFLATMSHELRTPLNAIIGYTEMTEEELLEGVISDDVVQDVGRIKSSSQHLLHIINMVLNLSKIEAGEEVANFSMISVEELVKDVSQFSRSLVTQSQNEFVVTMQVDPDTLVEVDVQKLVQVLLNLIGNANKFTERGTIELVISADTQSDCVEFKVLDDGIGLPEDQLKNLFQPFQQIENSFNRRYDGTGLGLAISKNYCDLMGAEISAANRPEVGACFSVKVKSVSE